MIKNIYLTTVYDNGRSTETFNEFGGFLEAFNSKLNNLGVNKDQITINKTSNLGYRLVLEDRAFKIAIWDYKAQNEFEIEFKDQISHDLDLTHKFVNYLYFDCKDSIYDFMLDWMLKNDLDIHELDKLHKDFIRAIRIEF